MAFKLKTCIRCGKRRRKYYRKGNGFDRWCIPCRKADNQRPERKASSVYRNMKARSLNKNGRCPTYASIELRVGYEEFKEWYVDAYTSWIAANPNKKATIDRIDNDGHYELSNMQILSLPDNVRKRPRFNKNVYAPAGQGWCFRCKGYLPLSDFHRNKNEHNGHESMCKTHKNSKSALYRKKIREQKKHGGT